MGDYTTAFVFGLILLITLALFVRNIIKFFKEGGQENLPDQKIKVKQTSSSTSGATSPRVTSGANKIVIGLERTKGGGPVIEQKSKELTSSEPKVAEPEKPQTKATQQELPKAETASPQPPKPAAKESSELETVEKEAPNADQAADAQAKAEVKVVEEQKPREAVAQPAAEVKADVAQVETNGEKPSKTESKWPPVRMQGPKEEDSKSIEKIQSVLSKYFEE